MKKKRKIIIVVISILIILLVILSVFLAKKYLHSESYNESKLAYHLDEKKISLDLCKKDNCIHAGNKLPYTILTLDYKIDSLQNEVEKINKKTEKIYKEDNNSSTSSPACSKVYLLLLSLSNFKCSATSKIINPTSLAFSILLKSNCNKSVSNSLYCSIKSFKSLLDLFAYLSLEK